jgi:hypothetical protein
VCRPHSDSAAAAQCHHTRLVNPIIS